MNPFKGTLTALVTPFRNGEIDTEALRRLVARQMHAGVDAIVPCGTTGEAPTLALEEYRDVLTCVVATRDQLQNETPNDKPVAVIAGAGTNATNPTITLAQLAEHQRADGILAVTPYYNKPSQQGLLQHYDALARATSLPIILYNIPARTGVRLNIDTITKLREKHDRIVAVKHATGDVAEAADLLAACEIGLLSGDDPLTLPLMAIGADGVVSVLANLFPVQVKELTDAALEGDLRTALRLHKRLYRCARTLLTLDTNPVPVKAALAMAELCSDEVRLPLTTLSDQARATLTAELRSVGSE